MDLKQLNTILVDKNASVATISLNRLQVHNAMDLEMIREITSTMDLLAKEKNIQCIVLTSRGTNFCAGADLNWMKQGLNQPEEELEKESTELAWLFRSIWESDAITISAVKGKVMGGGIGLLAASDLVIAESSATLSFSEVKLGLVPATIAPYVLRKSGFSRISEWMLTARAIPAAEARDAGLIHRICPEGSLKESTDQLLHELQSNGPEAMKGVKALLRKLDTESDPEEVDAYTSQLIARFRVSSEGQKRMHLFFDKRRPKRDETH